MVTTIETRGTKRWVRLSRAELQHWRDIIDAALPDGVKHAHPVEQFGAGYSQLGRRYPNQWVAIVGTEIDANGLDVAGRVLAVASELDELNRKIAALPLRSDGVRWQPLRWHTGEWPLPRGIALV